MITVFANCSVKQTVLSFVEAILCKRVGLCLTDEVEVFIHNNNVFTHTRLQFCFYWMIAYSETRA